MEAASVQQDGDRSRPPPFPRAASRSSTSSSKTRTTHLSSNSSFSHLPPSPQQSAAHPTHRFHHSVCSRGSSERPRSQLSREASEDSRQPLPPVSSFLQERLQRERKVESERSSSRLSNEPMSASSDLRTAQSSPARSGVSEGRRPRSSGGAEAVKKKGLGVKEMEQTLSNLHKQNFDLKLELYHRRERQTELEAKLERLETEKIQTDEMNDRLVVELEKRDKAVEEAVAMIVTLEARVEQLLKEREMVREVEDHGYLYTRDETPSPASDMPTPRHRDFERPKPEEEAKILARMPSFLSDHSEATSNLRNVYLGVRGSILSLSKTAEDGQDQERDELQGARSPSLSVLSESSFRSIYGEKDGTGLGNSSPSPPDVDPAPFDGLSESGRLRQTITSDKSQIVTPSKLRRIDSHMKSGAAKFQNISDILDVSGSPLQRLERMEELEKTLTAMDDASRPSTGHGRNTDSRLFNSRPVKPPVLPKTKQEKRDALQRVLTNGPLSRDFRNSQGLPPTPDTISTSTLRRLKNSNDTLPKESEFGGDRSFLTLSDTTASQQSTTPEKTANAGDSRAAAAQPASTTAFDGRKETSSDSSHFNGRFSSAQIPRPRSADETTISNRRGGRGRGDWDSDESDEDLDGAGSAVSTYDYWMRESLSPNRTAALNPFSSASQAGTQQDGRVSPDLFSFPTSTSGWATDAMFGTLGGSGYIGSAGGLPTATPLAQTLDALGDSLPRPLFGSGLASPLLGGANIPPPPPNRRSSLHARTGSSHAMVSGISSSPAGPSPSQTRLRTSPQRRARERSNSIDGPPRSSQSAARAAAAQMGRAPTAPPQHPMAVPDAPQQQQPKQRHYPPTASQPARGRGLNNLFRRSTGSAVEPQAPASAPATETSFKNIPSVAAPLVGVPTSWGSRRNGNDIFADDDRASATPPPIMRNRRGSVDGGAPLDVGALVDDIPRQNSQMQAQGSTSWTSNAASNGAPVKNDGGGKRKWLGFGRASSLRNRAG